MYILDTGGQPELFEVLPPFLSGSSINILIFRLIDELGKRYKVRYLSSEGEHVEEYDSSFTVEEVIFQVLSTFSSKAPTSPVLHSPQYPAVSTQSATLLVGTHKDLVSDEAVESIDNALQKKVKNSSLPESEIIHYPNPDEKQTPPFKLVVPIDNTKKLDPGISLLQDLISNTLDDKIVPVQIPMPWLMFEHSVRSTGRSILSFRECAVIGRECGIKSDEELQTALRFLS